VARNVDISYMERTMNVTLNFAARVLMAQMFLLAGASKLGRMTETQAYMEHMGVPGILLPLVILTEVVGGIALLVGFRVRFAAFVLAAFTLLSAFIFHRNFADQSQLINFMKNLAITGGLLMFVVHGARYARGESTGVPARPQARES
jgi:putative oxidoreductase